MVTLKPVDKGNAFPEPSPEPTPKISTGWRNFVSTSLPQHLSRIANAIGIKTPFKHQKLAQSDKLIEVKLKGDTWGPSAMEQNKAETENKIQTAATSVWKKAVSRENPDLHKQFGPKLAQDDARKDANAMRDARAGNQIHENEPIDAYGRPEELPPLPPEPPKSL